jgi:glucosamine--fructose-6-phosphate aminotransferase (isomerizing)
MMSRFEEHLRSQPDELERLLSDPRAREEVHAAAEGLHRVRRLWVVGTGSSQHAAAIGAAMLQDAGRSAHAVSSMQFVRNAPIVGGQDGVIVVTHSGESSYAIAARALAFTAGLQTVTVARRGIGMNDIVETVDREGSETTSVGYTSAVLALAMIASEMGADSLTRDALALVPGSVRNAIETSANLAVPQARGYALVGAGPAAVTAQEAALLLRQAARTLALGADAEYFLHGAAAPYGREDHLVALSPPDEDGFVEAVARGAEAEGIGVTRVHEPAPLPPLLAQIPLAVRCQMIAGRAAAARGMDPDHVAAGAWADPALRRIGTPERGTY